MQLIFCLQFLLLVLMQIGYGSSSFIEVEDCGEGVYSQIDPDRIVGGTDVIHGEYPFMVSLRKGSRSSPWCGGVVLNENWIVTAAHCFGSSSSPDTYEVLLGLHRLYKTEESTVRRHKLSRIVIHSEYNHENFKNDIALLKTSRPIDIEGSGGYINGICLPTSKKDPKGLVNIIGWGTTTEGGDYSDALQKITVPLISRETCRISYPRTVFDTTICAGRPGQDACKADSGGPVFRINSKGKAVLVGIVSHSVGCARPFYPGVHMNIAKYVDWMEDVIMEDDMTLIG